MNRAIVLAGTVLCAAAALATTANPAHAAGQDGVANTGEFVFHHGLNLAGSFVDFSNPKQDLAGYTFLTSGGGQGETVKNNAKSVRNLDPTTDARVYYNSYYMGPSDLVAAGTGRNLDKTFKENASFKWI